MAKVTGLGKRVQLGHLNLDLKLNGRAILNIEKRLKKSVISLFMNADGGMKMPPTNEILIVLQGANQTHGVTDSEMVKAFQEFLDAGNSPMDLFLTLTDLFNESGFFNVKDGSKAEAKEVSLDNSTDEETDQADSL